MIVAPIFFETSSSNRRVFKSAFANSGHWVRSPAINAPMTVLGINRLIWACFPIKALDPFRTTMIISPSCTFSELTTVPSTNTLSASTISPLLTLDERRTKVPLVLTSAGVYVNPEKNSAKSVSLRCSQAKAGAEVSPQLLLPVSRYTF